MNFFFIKLKKLIKFFYQFLVQIYVFELTIYKKNTLSNKLNFFLIDKNAVKKKLFLRKYFLANKLKIKRFKNSKFIGIKYKKEIICSGWAVYKQTKKWHIEEINKYINFENHIVLYDFRTLDEYKNRGYYKNLLKYIQNRFIGKRLVIYTLSSNLKSQNAIKKTNFKKTNEIKKIF